MRYLYHKCDFKLWLSYSWEQEPTLSYISSPGKCSSRIASFKSQPSRCPLKTHQIRAEPPSWQEVRSRGGLKSSSWECVRLSERSKSLYWLTEAGSAQFASVLCKMERPTHLLLSWCCSLMICTSSWQILVRWTLSPIFLPFSRLNLSSVIQRATSPANPGLYSSNSHQFSGSWSRINALQRQRAEGENPWVFSSLPARWQFPGTVPYWNRLLSQNQAFWELWEIRINEWSFPGEKDIKIEINAKFCVRIHCSVSNLVPIKTTFRVNKMIVRSLCEWWSSFRLLFVSFPRAQFALGLGAKLCA